MKLQGITIDFYDKRTCGLLPDLCTQWDIRYDELEDNEELLKYWEESLKKVLAKTDKVVSGNVEGKSILYSADEEAIKIIKEEFSELELQTIEYEDIIRCEHCITHDYLEE
ncbi:hypothetical protein [Halarcobacter bivalviorum]|uniref:hypothetical protein n=1 Tax=Halarcobacter bivalviorum TaxID=663364 RepID=UPI00100C209E|nr:hypothetical protein [Halarcobacter bivalviorum]RXK07246.1 hypothetical protein CRU97_03820 [Halarcobacter bivalviorum]